jgi:eukaryotic-like serine/threonine-protein kinase
MLEKGAEVCGYKIVEPIGSGGLSQNYKALNPDGTFVTLKFPSTELVGDPATYERFLRESKIGQKLSHPAIPRAISLSENKTGPCLALEYIEGKSLRSVLQERAPLSTEQALDFISQLAEAVSYLHKNGVFHRDLKPENILVDSAGKIHIVDFGIALLQGARRVTWQNLSDALGTPDYMAPEQVQGKRGDARTDLYALGIILYEMLTGAVPFHGDNALAVMHLHLTATPPPPRQSNPAIPANLEAIIMKAVRKNPKERYQSADAFLADLQNYQQLDISQFPRGREQVAGLVTNRQIWILGGAIAFGFVAIIALIIIIALLIHSR